MSLETDKLHCHERSEKFHSLMRIFYVELRKSSHTDGFARLEKSTLLVNIETSAIFNGLEIFWPDLNFLNIAS